MIIIIKNFISLLFIIFFSFVSVQMNEFNSSYLTRLKIFDRSKKLYEKLYFILKLKIKATISITSLILLIILF
jgi:hypothetical protein